MKWVPLYNLHSSLWSKRLPLGIHQIAFTSTRRSIPFQIRLGQAEGYSYVLLKSSLNEPQLNILMLQSFIRSFLNHFCVLLFSILFASVLSQCQFKESHSPKEASSGTADGTFHLRINTFSVYLKEEVFFLLSL